MPRTLRKRYQTDDTSFENELVAAAKDALGSGDETAQRGRTLDRRGAKRPKKQQQQRPNAAGEAAANRLLDAEQIAAAAAASAGDEEAELHFAEPRELSIPEPDQPELLEAEVRKFGSKAIIRSVQWKPAQDCVNLDAFLLALERKATALIVNDLAHQHSGTETSLRVALEILIEYDKMIDTKRVPLDSAISLRTKPVVVFSRAEGDIRKQMSHLCDVLSARHQNSSRGSGLAIRSIEWAKMHVGQFNPLRGGKYVKLPAAIEAKRAVVNVKNTDERCFGYAILACKYAYAAYEKNKNEPSQYNRFFGLEPRLAQLRYPVAWTDLSEAEQVLEQPVNVFSFGDDSGKNPYLVYRSKIDPKQAINLLYWQGHYSWIKDFPRLMSSVTKKQARKYFCMQCLGHFSSENILARHEELCTGDERQQVLTMMPEGSILEFRNVRYQQRCPLVLYADFECITRRIEPGQQEAAGNDSPLDVKPRAAYQVHQVNAVGLTCCATLDGEENFVYESHFGEDSSEWLLTRVAEIEKEWMERLLSPQRLHMTDEDSADFACAKLCYVCGKQFTANNWKVRDHDHVTGTYRGAAHNNCNLLLRQQYKIPVFYHNWRGYDSHLVVSVLGKQEELRQRKLKVIGQGMEKYLVLEFGKHIVFKDSLQFLCESLERLVASLSANGTDFSKFKRLRASFADLDDERFALLLRKGIYPYDYMNSFERFDEAQLPPIEAFTSRLRQEVCSEADYVHAQRMWTTFGCRTMRDYHDLYLKMDVLQLADVFDAFRKVCMENYDLDPAYYVSAPHLAWDAMLKKTGCELELLSDPEMYRMLSLGLRGGVAMVSKRHAKANSARLGAELHEAQQPTKEIIYLDANNLYGWCMSQALPERGFRWLTKEEVREASSADYWLRVDPHAELGYIVECDLDYPNKLHDAHNDYPLAPERMAIDASMLSDKQHAIARAYSRGTKMVHSHDMEAHTKLVPNLYSKERYVVHSRVLRYYIEHGLVLRRVHRVIEFKQSEWMRSYIELNQRLRAESQHDFEKTFYKLMNNSVYGKTCENQRKRTDIHLLTSEAEAERLLGLPQVLGFRVFTRNVAAIELQKPRCVINRPFYVGFTVLELAKLHMYKFHYDFVKQLWPGEQSQLLFTDTDSLMYEITGDERMFERIWENRDEFDLSDYPRDSPWYDATNKKVIGKFKDETNGTPVLEFVGLRAKMYSFLTLKEGYTEPVEKLRAKGIQRAAAKHIRHADFLRELHNPRDSTVTNRRIGSHLHRLYTYEFEKAGLCAFDDKRYILEDGVRTLAYGHWRVDAPAENELHKRDTVATARAHDTMPVEEFDATLLASTQRSEAANIGTRRHRASASNKHSDFDPNQPEWQSRLARLEDMRQDADNEALVDFGNYLPFAK